MTLCPLNFNFFPNDLYAKSVKNARNSANCETKVINLSMIHRLLFKRYYKLINRRFYCTSRYCAKFLSLQFLKQQYFEFDKIQVVIHKLRLRIFSLFWPPWLTFLLNKTCNFCLVTLTFHEPLTPPIPVNVVCERPLIPVYYEASQNAGTSRKVIFNLIWSKYQIPYRSKTFCFYGYWILKLWYILKTQIVAFHETDCHDIIEVKV